MGSKISQRVANSSASNDDNFIKTVIGLTKVFPGYTIDMILTKTRIPQTMAMAESAFGGAK